MRHNSTRQGSPRRGLSSLVIDILRLPLPLAALYVCGLTFAFARGCA